MAKATDLSELDVLLRLMDQAYDKKSWHGPNLRGSVRGLTAARAAWRPRPDRHCIAEIVVHAAYWKYAGWRRLTGEKRGSFALGGSNWFALPAPLDDAAWKSYVKLLDQEHRRFRAAVAKLPPARLREVPAGSKVTNSELIQGVAAHDLYHAGQVQILKRLHVAE